MKTLPMAHYGPPPVRPAYSKPHNPPPRAIPTQDRRAAAHYAACNLTQLGPDELARAVHTVTALDGALRPFVSPARTAYLRVTAEVARREAAA